MSYVIPAYAHEDEETPQESVTMSALRFVPRDKRQWLLFLPSTIICGLSFMLDGEPRVTDFGFALLTVMLGACLICEFYRFPVRFGIGGLVLFGGSLCWFCQDYFTHWYGINFMDSTVGLMPAWVIAKAAFLHSLFIMMMTVGLNWKTAGPVQKLLLCLPDLRDDRFYLWVVLAMFAIGISPFFIFNSEPSYMAIYHALFGSFVGQAAQLTVFRTGNLNYSWGGYVAQIMEIGEVGSIFAILYALMIGKGFFDRAITVMIWLFWFSVGFQTDRRGEVAFFFMPMIALLFIKYQARAAMMFKRFSLRAYVVCGACTVVLLWLVQFQATFRGSGYGNADLSRIEIGKNQGNTMFSEGLKAYALIPNAVPFFRDSFPGESIVRPIPQTIVDFIVGMIPRALWHDKPVDALWKWYNEIYLGVADGTKGTTISHGLVGSWYFAYGLPGLVEGGILVGVLMGVSERALQNSEGKPLGVFVSLGFATWLFRTYRDWIFIDLYGLVIGCIGLYILIYIMKPFFGGNSGGQSSAGSSQLPYSGV